MFLLPKSISLELRLGKGEGLLWPLAWMTRLTSALEPQVCCHVKMVLLIFTFVNATALLLPVQVNNTTIHVFRGISWLKETVSSPTHRWPCCKKATCSWLSRAFHVHHTLCFPCTQERTLSVGDHYLGIFRWFQYGSNPPEGLHWNPWDNLGLQLYAS